MKKFYILTAFMLCASSVTKAQSFSETIDEFFRNISRADATTGILYERIIPFAQLLNFNSHVAPVDTSNNEHFIQAYSELYDATFLPSNSFPFNSDSLQFLTKNSGSIVDIGILHYNFNTLDPITAYQKLYFGADVDEAPPNLPKGEEQAIGKPDRKRETVAHCPPLLWRGGRG